MHYKTHRDRIAGARAVRDRETWYAFEYYQEPLARKGKGRKSREFKSTYTLHVFTTHTARTEFVNQTWTENHYCRRVTRKEAERGTWNNIINHAI